MNSIIKQGKNVFLNTYKQFDLVFEAGEGCRLIDSTGKSYLDFVSGIAVNALGYSNENMKSALKNQIDQLLHCSNLYWNEQSVKAATKLVEISGLDKVFFCNSGAEANEAALKLSRKYAKKNIDEERYEIISMKDSFHGRTLATITATGQEKYQEHLSPLLPGIKYAKYNDIKSLEDMISENTCAVLLEPLQGEGGIKPAEKEYLTQVRSLCDAHQIVLIFDEVQTGIGRSGEFFAYQYYNVIPDIVCLAKGLGGGVPVGAIITNDKVAKGFEPGDHASTFGGNLLATCAVNSVLNEIENMGILENVKQQGAYLTEKLLELQCQHSDIIKDVRGFGLIQGIEIENKSIPELISACIEEGLLLVGAGKNVVRFVPPLVVTKKDIDQAIDILAKC